MGYIDEARNELQKWYDNIDVETFTTQYESLKSVREQREYISDLRFNVYEDKSGVLYLVTYDEHFDTILEVFYGYENGEIGMLSNHIRTLYEPTYYEGARFFWCHKLKSYDYEYVDAMNLKDKFLFMDDIADEFGVYQDNFGKSSDVEFNKENLLMVTKLIYRD